MATGVPAEDIFAPPCREFLREITATRDSIRYATKRGIVPMWLRQSWEADLFYKSEPQVNGSKEIVLL